ncbi:MAG: alkaline phosphatase family protein [Pseudomonadota bacterium]
MPDSNATKCILVILDGLGWEISRSLLGNIEGWVASGEANVWKMRSVLPSTSGPCYASIHTGVHPQEHGVLSNSHEHAVSHADIFSEVKSAGKVSAAVAHSYFSTYFQSDPFVPLRDLEVNDPTRVIPYARFYTMTGESSANLAVPSDFDLATQTTILMQQHMPDYVLLHLCSPDSVNHKYGPQSIECDLNTYQVDVALAHYLPTWREQGYEVMITADHGHSDKGHHGGTTAAMREVAFYYFGSAIGPTKDEVLCQTQIAPSILKRIGISIPESMQSKAFL